MPMEHPRFKNLRMATRPPAPRPRTRVPDTGWRGPVLKAKSKANFQRALQRAPWGRRPWVPALIASGLIGLGWMLGSLTAIMILPFALVATYSFCRGEGGELAVFGMLAMIGALLVFLVKAG